ncbi:hypothetical protein Swit_2200 [Rhizorhabdus wittichii RW1]|uniref:Uncharacterized protein n=1 Tax=Rhizorhabdus wittichii (strain DSM 6014 / CCUG 31198 / JCM 15750 / NBRC 105917 / EY 4224 / RW1) TaxID=392499 RepID=A0A9J9HBT6_RHIWR|nr:hypothetical protein Swit_2200 [Rhizorhabdus wittichii RW1]
MSEHKADYVRGQAPLGAGNHHCHWTGCAAKVPPAMWGCRKHWYMLPADIRNRIWRTFRPGQEIAKTPSAEYVTAAREARDWIAANHPPQGAAADLFGGGHG